MPLRQYERWEPKEKSERLVDLAVQICEQYARQGYDLTLRQLYYQFINRNVFPNTEHSYDQLGSLVDRARMAGMIDWNQITDRTRGIAGNTHWTSPAEIIQAAALSFRLDRWKDQPVRVEVWVEKEALAGVVSRAAGGEDVDYFSCRGYASSSSMWRAAQRLLGYIADGQRVIVLHLGDHDPSGIDMTRDNRDRLRTYMGADWVRDEEPYIRRGREPWEVPWEEVEESMLERLRDTDAEHAFEFRRIALNMDQVRRYQPPPNPAKITDSRAGKYIERFGRSSWELDALDPATLDALIREHIREAREGAAWASTEAEENSLREILTATTNRWDEVADFLTSTEE